MAITRKRKGFRKGPRKSGGVGKSVRTIKNKRTKLKAELLLAKAKLESFMERHAYEEPLKERYEDMTVFALQALLAEYEENDAQDESENPDLMKMILRIKTLPAQIAQLRA